VWRLPRLVFVLDTVESPLISYAPPEYGGRHEAMQHGGGGQRKHSRRGELGDGDRRESMDQISDDIDELNLCAYYKYEHTSFKRLVKASSAPGAEPRTRQ
jgi:hypothetical protein